MDFLAFAYENGGPGLAKNLKTARDWYEKAVTLGNADAAFNLGRLYRTGAPGVPVNGPRARELFQRGVDKGDVKSTDWLGWLLLDGSEGVPKDAKTAGDLFEKAAAAGNTDSMIGLGDLYSHYDQSNSPYYLNVALARQWYQKAADAGNQEAKTRLTTSCVADNSCR